MTAPLYIALVHYPIVNKIGDIVTTSITNFDLHDLARTGTTFGVKSCFIVTPSVPQQNMANYIKGYWKDGFGSSYNPDRKEAFDILEVSESLNETCLTIQKHHDTSPTLVATSARRFSNTIGFVSLKEKIEKEEKPYLLVFGTGWGLAPSVMDQVDLILAPISGGGEYNHLPVRSAVAIVLDRLVGK